MSDHWNFQRWPAAENGRFLQRHLAGLGNGLGQTMGMHGRTAIFFPRPMAIILTMPLSLGAEKSVCGFTRLQTMIPSDS